MSIIPNLSVTKLAGELYTELKKKKYSLIPPFFSGVTSANWFNPFYRSNLIDLTRKTLVVQQAASNSDMLTHQPSESIVSQPPPELPAAEKARDPFIPIVTDSLGSPLSFNLNLIRTFLNLSTDKDDDDGDFLVEILSTVIIPEGKDRETYLRNILTRAKSFYSGSSNEIKIECVLLAAILANKGDHGILEIERLLATIFTLEDSLARNRLINFIAEQPENLRGLHFLAQNQSLVRNRLIIEMARANIIFEGYYDRDQLANFEKKQLINIIGEDLRGVSGLNSLEKNKLIKFIIEEPENIEGLHSLARALFINNYISKQSESNQPENLRGLYLVRNIQDLAKNAKRLALSVPYEMLPDAENQMVTNLIGNVVAISPFREMGIKFLNDHGYYIGSPVRFFKGLQDLGVEPTEEDLHNLAQTCGLTSLS